MFFLALLGAFPALVTALGILWTGGYTTKVVWTLSVFVLGFWLLSALALRERVVFPLQTLSNMLAALREGDYSIRGRTDRADDSLSEVMREVNALSRTLREQRRHELEATTLLAKVLAEIDVAIFAFDGQGLLWLANRAGGRLYGTQPEALLGSSAEGLGLQEFLQGERERTIQRSFPGAEGRWGLRRSTFREEGLPFQLLVLSDLNRALREEELEAWRRIIRVLGHELKNSLTPIKSMASTLSTLLQREPPPEDWQEDALRCLEIIGSRADALNRFMTSYARLARLPAPQLKPVVVDELVQRVVGLEHRMEVELSPGPPVQIQADRDQLEQALINIVKNAVEASQETGGRVQLTWERLLHHVEIRVEDEGHGLSNTANLFVPFFTTKPGGSGIGLVLSRQIAEAHHGTLNLIDKTEGPGCQALLRLPL